MDHNVEQLAMLHPQPLIPAKIKEELANQRQAFPAPSSQEDAGGDSVDEITISTCQGGVQHAPVGTTRSNLVYSQQDIRKQSWEPQSWTGEGK